MARVKGQPTRYPGIERVASERFERGYGYRARADAREQGRGQPEKTFATAKEARDWKAEVETKAAAGTYVGRSTLTVAEALEAWAVSEGGAPNTVQGRRDALKPVVTMYGTRRVQSMTKADVEALLPALAAGQIKGTDPRALSYINRTRGMWQSCWADLVRQGVLPRNVVELVKPMKRPQWSTARASGSGLFPSSVTGEPRPSAQAALDPGQRIPEKDLAALLAAHAPGARERPTSPSLRAYRAWQRRAVFIELALLGLRRGELAGLRWSAITDLDAEHPLLRVERTRVAEPGGAVEKLEGEGGGKTAAAIRELLLPPNTVAALRRHRDLQAEDRKRSGRSWKGDPDLGVLTKDNGRIVSPSTLDNWWHDCMDAAGITGYRLHDMRHTAASRLLAAQIPLMDLASWLGHADGGVLALRVYGHTDPADLGAAAAALAHL